MARQRKRKSYTPSRGHFKGRSFKTRHTYRNALARAKGFKNDYQRRKHFVRVSSSGDLASLSVAARDKRADALEVLGIVRRENKSLAMAVRLFNESNPVQKISSQAVLKYAGAAFEKKGRLWKAKPHDRLLRIMRFQTPRGSIPIEVKDSRTATKIAQYQVAVGQYLETGDEGYLIPFRGKEFTSNRIRYRFITDPDLLRQLAEAGEFHFDSIYEELSSGH